VRWRGVRCGAARRCGVRCTAARWCAVQCGALGWGGVRRIAVCCGTVRCGMVRCGVVCRGVRCGAATVWCGVVCSGVQWGGVRCGAVRRGAARCGAAGCGAAQVRCSAVRCGAARCAGQCSRATRRSCIAIIQSAQCPVPVPFRVSCSLLLYYHNSHKRPKIHMAIFQPPGGLRRCLVGKRAMWNTGTMTWGFQGNLEWY
jgi:hypothetical protein